MAYIIVCVILGVSFLILANYSVFTVIYRPRAAALSPYPSGPFPKVSILKPISNVDDEMDVNVESFYALDYPDYEIVFGLDTGQKECLELVENARKRHPGIRTTIVSTTSEKKLNPKVTTLSDMEPHCAGELFWMTDSNVRVGPNTLKDLVHEYLTHQSKIVFSPIQGTGSGTIGSVIENAYLNFFVSGNIISAWKFLRQQIIVGKSMLIEKKTLASFGGFVHFKEYLAEDFIMGRTYTEHRFPISTNCTWVTNYISTASIGKFWHRVVRWAKIRYNTERGFYFIEILVNPIMLSLISISFLGTRGLALTAASVILKVTFEYVTFFAVAGEDRKKLWVVAAFPFIIILKDLLLLFIYFTPLFSKDVYWRGKSIRIDNRGKIVSIHQV